MSLLGILGLIGAAAAGAWAALAKQYKWGPFLEQEQPDLAPPSPVEPEPVETPVELPTPVPEPVPAPKYPPMVLKWAKAIEHGEGASIASNNPGNLKYSGLTASWGAKKGRAATDGGFLCKFDAFQVGMDALCNFLVLGCKNELIAFHSPEARTLVGFTKIYAGNPPKEYIEAIVKALAVSPQVSM